MTQNQIKYWDLKETERSNRAKEQETYRHNLAQEAISLRANDISMLTAQENVRHNIAYEQETQRHNAAGEMLSGMANDISKMSVGLGYSQLSKQAEISYAQLAEKQAYDEATIANQQEKMRIEQNIANLDRGLKTLQTQYSHQENMYGLGIKQSEAVTNRMNAETRKGELAVSEYNASTNRQNANTNAVSGAASSALNIATFLTKSGAIGLLLP